MIAFWSTSQMLSQPTRPQDLRTDDQKLASLNRLLIFMAAFATIVLFMTAYSIAAAFNRQELVIHVIENQAPTTCWVFTGKQSWRSYRSSKPKYGEQGFCGYVLTDHGMLTTPQTSWLHPFEDSRAKIVTALQPHCDYRVVVAGFGLEAKPGVWYTNGPVKTIVRVLGTEHCELHL